jgi:hypothetical protein
LVCLWLTKEDIPRAPYSTIHEPLPRRGRELRRTVSWYFPKSLLDPDLDEVNQFLFSVAKQKTASSTCFKHKVSGLRFLFRLYGLEDCALRLPSLSNDGNLPVLLSAEELRRLFFAPQRLKQRGPPFERMSANPNFEVQ